MFGRGAVPGISSTGATLVRGYTRHRQELQLADELHRHQASSEFSQAPTPHERVTGNRSQLTHLWDMHCRVKLVVVGNQHGGKTKLIKGLANSYGSFRLRDPDPSPGYQPTAATNGGCEYNVPDGDYLELTAELWDTSGQEALRRLRAYPGTDITLYVCWDHQSAIAHKRA